ncbi:hypothetical protein QTO34_009745 [Cnephaeus nilssonii]|uniref:Uncharacterized protein n=1 Tax=Cnephaeus nilssonii TaxID=3371016 RepID=A0AA40LGH6_CNENI|nr:hypothetical protein QTO34_009745 [Eptesicus nilssonii]
MLVHSPLESHSKPLSTALPAAFTAVIEGDGRCPVSPQLREETQPLWVLHGELSEERGDTEGSERFLPELCCSQRHTEEAFLGLTGDLRLRPPPVRA